MVVSQSAVGVHQTVTESLRLARLVPVLLVALLLPLAAVADTFPPYWEGGSGGAIHYDPVPWPADDGDGELDFGDWIPYTMIGSNVEDQKVQDPSNGGTSPQNYVNVSSGCTDLTLPSTFWYYDATNQVFMYRWRVEQIPHTYATGPSAGTFSSVDPWKSALWTVFFDIDGDGYREFAVHVDGSSGGPSEDVDRLFMIYSDTPSQSIDYVNDPNICLLGHNPTAFVDGPTSPDTNTDHLYGFNGAWPGPSPAPSWVEGSDEVIWDYGTTRAVKIEHATCDEYFVDYQIPIAALDATSSPCAGPVMTEDSPFRLAYATANSLQNPLQKDVVLDGTDFFGDPLKPMPFGDCLTAVGGPAACGERPVVETVTAAGCGPATLSATVADAILTSGGTAVDTIASVSFFSYEDANANGSPDDGNSWTFAAAGSATATLGIWTASWDSTSLPLGQFLIGVQAVDDQGNLTYSYLDAASASPDFANPTPDPGLVWGIFTNVCGTSPSVSKTASVSQVAVGGTVDFTITVNADTVSALSVSSINDSLPAGWTYDSDQGGTLTPTTSPSPGASGTVTWTFTPSVVIAAGGSGTLIFRATAPTVQGSYQNIADTVSTAGTYTSDPIEIGVGAPELSIDKTADVVSAAPGATVTFTITYANSSPVSVTNAVVTDVLPTGLSFVSAGNGGSYDSGTRTITWNVGNLGAGEGPYSVSFQATVDNPYPGGAGNPLSNTGTIDSTESNPASDDASLLILLPLAIDKTSSTPVVSPGGTATYTITFANNGTTAATGASLSDIMPVGFSYVPGSTCLNAARPCTPAADPGVAGQTLTWAAVNGGGDPAGTISTGNTGYLSYQATVGNPYTGPDPATNTATLSAAGLSSVTDTYDIGVPQACSSPTTYYLHDRVPDPDTADTTPGADPFSTITYTPAGGEFAWFYQTPVTSESLYLTSANTAFTYYATKGGGSNPTVTVTLYDYNPGTSTRDATIGSGSNTVTGGSKTYPLTWSAAWTYTLPAGHQLLWVFSTGSSGAAVTIYFDGTPGSSNDSQYDLCPESVWTTMNKSVSPLAAAAGATLSYTIDFSNPSQVAMTGAQIVDTIPTGVSYSPGTTLLNGAAASDPGIAGQTLTFSPVNGAGDAAGSISSGNSGTLSFQVTVANPFTAGSTTLVNTATLQTTEAPDVSDSASTTVNRPNLVISKAVDASLLLPGDSATYTLTVSNAGNANAANLTVTDVLPVDTYYSYQAASCAEDLSAAPSTSVTSCSESAGTLTYTADLLAPGETITISWSMDVGVPPSGPPTGTSYKDNSATATTSSDPASATSNTVRVWMSTNPNLVIGKSSSPAAGPLSPGDTVTYTVVVTNIGYGDALDVAISDPIPAYTTYVAGSLTYDAAAQTDPDDADTGHYGAVAGQVVFDIGTMAYNDSHTVSFDVVIDSPLADGTTVISNTATVSSSNAAAKQATKELDATAAANLDISKTAPASKLWPLTTLNGAQTAVTSLNVNDASAISLYDYISVNGTDSQVTAISGNTLTLSTAVSGANGDPVDPVILFQISYLNSGDADATSVTVSDTLPANTTYVASDPAGTWTGPAPGTVDWSIGAVAAGDGGALKLWARPLTTGTYSNSATIDSDQTSPTSSNTTTTNIGTLDPSKIVNPPTGGPQAITHDETGSQVTYEITVVNNTGIVVTGIEVTDTMEKGFAYSSTTSTSFTGAASARTATVNPTAGDNPAVWGTWTLDVGSTLTITFVADIGSEAGTGTYQNAVSVSAANAQQYPFDELATTQEDVQITWNGPNQVVISDFTTAVCDGVVVVRWQTDAENASAGFRLERSDYSRGGWHPINEGWLPALVAAPHGGSYTLIDSTAPTAGRLSYRLLERETDGDELSYGPFVVEPIRDERCHLPSMPSNGFIARPHPPSTPPAHRPDVMPVPGSGLKIAVREPGLYQVSSAEIAAALGVDQADAAAMIRSGRLTLSYAGQEIAWTAGEPRDGVGRSATLLFYGEGSDSIYSHDRIYLLEEGHGTNMTTVALTPHGRPPGFAQQFRASLSWEEDSYPQLTAPLATGDEFWFWDYLMAGQGSKQYRIDAPAASLNGDLARLTVRLRGGTLERHLLVASLNGEPIGEAFVQGLNDAELGFWVRPELLLETNTVSLEALFAPGTESSFLWLDGFELAYDRYYDADLAPSLCFSSNGERTLRLTGFSDPEITLLDITDSVQPRLALGYKVVPVAATGTYEVQLSPGSWGEQYLAVTPDGIRRPERTWVEQPSSLLAGSNAADYLIITTAELATTAAQLAHHRQGQGLATMVIDIEDVWDELNGGQPDPNAIRSLLVHASRFWSRAPRYVVLVGEGTHDYNDIYGFGSNLVPPLLLGGSSGLFGSDSSLADLVPGDGVPEVAIGRIPVVNPQELQAYISKIISYESAGGGWTETALVVADDPDERGDYPGDSERLAALLERQVPPQSLHRLYVSELGAGETAARLQELLSNGAFLMTYTGHAGLTTLAHERVLSTATVDSLTNDERLPVVLLLGCHAGNFWLPGYPSLAEELVLHAGGGAAAVWTPVGVSYHPKRLVLGEAFLQALEEQHRGVLGDVMLRAFEIAADQLAGSEQETMLSQVLLGDPALLLPPAGGQQ